MRLLEAVVEGYRSIRDPLRLLLDQDVTVILGANDHGKTNLLRALTHLNEDSPITESDLHWDLEGKPEYPVVEYTVALSVDERDSLLAMEKTHRASRSDGPADEPEKLLVVPDAVTIRRSGIGTPRIPIVPAGFNESVFRAFVTEWQPRMELFSSLTGVRDSISWPELSQIENEFMRGIFHYAGLNPNEAEGLFDQTDRTEMELRNASQKLNETLRQSWNQGNDLQFGLSHRAGRIELKIFDPTVASRFVRPSHRSTGFTHFFTLKTILYARQQEHKANSFVFLFDEPGTGLHPAGQFDLLRVLNIIGRANQVVYATHSIFLIDRTFPSRHRLLVKNDSGTKLDGKPYTSRWAPTFSALGISMAGTALFASAVLLGEGDSDAILIPPVLQRLMESGRAAYDLNSFAVVSSGNSKNTDVLVRMLAESVTRPRIALLTDGDDGGKGHIKAVKPVLDAFQIPSKTLLDGTTIEDYLPLAETLYVRAVVAYAVKLAKTYAGKEIESEKAFDEARGDFASQFAEGKVTSGLAKWGMAYCQKLANLPNPPSKVGIAREYVALLEAIAPNDLPTGVRVVFLGNEGTCLPPCQYRCGPGRLTLQRTEDFYTHPPTGSLRRASTLMRIIIDLLPLPKVSEVSQNILEEDE